MDFECLPVERFSELMKKQDGSPGKPRLVKSERSGHAIWVTELGSYLKGAESDRQSGTSEVSE